MARRLLFVSMIRVDEHGVGGQQRYFSLLSALRKVADVHQLILGDDPNASATDEVYLPSLNGPPRDLSRVLPFVFKGLLDLAQGHAEHSVRLSAADRAVVRKRIETGGYDAIFCCRPICADVVLSSLGRNLREIEVFTDLDGLPSDSLLAESRIMAKSVGIQMTVARILESLFARRIEQRAIRQSKMSFVCSDIEASRGLARYPGGRLKVIPNVAHVERLPSRVPDGSCLRVLFVGSLYYPPNLDGLTWLLDTLWPPARERLGERLKLDVVGRGSADMIAPYAGIAGVGFHLNVAAVEPYYEQADACVMPIRYGEGTSIKTIEAMMAGRPILSTSGGVRGLGMIDGHHYLGFENAAGFVTACEELANGLSLSASLVAAADSHWRTRFSQDAVDAIVAAEIG